MPQHYRVIVIGYGANGAATAYWQLMHRTGGLVIAERAQPGSSPSRPPRPVRANSM
jgi:hypothetical protein